MFAVYASEPNAADPLSAITVGERPDPEIPDGWVRVKVAAASVNAHDLSTLRGKLRVDGGPRKFPMILGCDGAGTLDDGTEIVIHPIIGDASWRGPMVGDPHRRAFGELEQGTFADYVAVPRANAIPIPDGLSLASAAVLGAAWLTAYRMLFTRSQLQPGQTMLVQGASGGVSTALIQLGRAAGMVVWVMGRSEEKLAVAAKIGAHETFLSGAQLPGLADAAFNTAGAPAWDSSIYSVRPGGTVVFCAGGGQGPSVDLNHLVRNELNIRPVFAGTTDELRQLMAFVVASGIEPQVGHSLPMDHAKDGFRMLLEGCSSGKVLLTR